MKIKRTASLLLAVLMVLTMAAGCGKAKVDPPNATTATYDEMVNYLESEGYIKKGTTPIDINTTAGYVTDNTDGSFPFATLADKAYDYDGLWLFWWDLENQTEAYERYEAMCNNSGTIVVAGGACIIATEAHRGAFAIAFSEDYSKKDAALEAFSALETN